MVFNSTESIGFYTFGKIANAHDYDTCIVYVCYIYTYINVDELSNVLNDRFYPLSQNNARNKKKCVLWVEPKFFTGEGGRRKRMTQATSMLQ
jgi:hypothetical protein